MIGCRLRPTRSSMLVLIFSTLRQVRVKVWRSPVSGLSRGAGSAKGRIAVVTGGSFPVLGSCRCRRRVPGPASGRSPVRARKTSSRLALRRVNSASSTRASSSSRMMAGSTAASATGTRTRPESASVSGTDPVRPASTAAATSSRLRSAGCTSSTCPPDLSFSSSGVPVAITLPWSMTTMSWASWSASSRYCVVSSTVTPSATRARTMSHTSLRLRGSRPVVGSSRYSTRGRPTRLAARSSRRRMPPE